MRLWKKSELSIETYVAGTQKNSLNEHPEQMLKTDEWEDNQNIRLEHFVYLDLCV